MELASPSIFDIFEKFEGSLLNLRENLGCLDNFVPKNLEWSQKFLEENTKIAKIFIRTFLTICEEDGRFYFQVFPRFQKQFLAFFYEKADFFFLNLGKSWNENRFSYFFQKILD